MIRQMKPTSFSRLSFGGFRFVLLSAACFQACVVPCFCFACVSCRGDDDDTPPPVPDHTAILHLRLGGDVAAVPHVASAASGGWVRMRGFVLPAG